MKKINTQQIQEKKNDNHDYDSEPEDGPDHPGLEIEKNVKNADYWEKQVKLMV